MAGINKEEWAKISVETQKLEIIEWILSLKDVSPINELIQFKKSHPNTKKDKRKFGSGKHIFTYIAKDFDAPLDSFKGYMLLCSLRYPHSDTVNCG